MPEPTPEVLSLIRFSTAEQVALGKAGIEGQQRVNEIAAQSHKVKIRKHYVLIDVPGRHVIHDPQVQEMLKQKGITGWIVAELSRLSRPATFEDWALLAYLQRHHILIFTPTGIIDANTPEGRMSLTMGAMMSGEELHNLKSRFARGKMIARLERKNPVGNQSLPRGIEFVRERNEAGKVVGFHWQQDPVKMAKMQRAFELLMVNQPLELIAKKTGIYGSGSALKRAMQNPIWVGIRRYPWECGDEYIPEPTAKNPNPKPRRHLLRREIPLDIPTFEELAAGTLPVVAPIMSVESWQAAQANIRAREGIVRKTRVKNEERPRFLGMGIVFCSCGAMMYGRYGSDDRFYLDRYYCKSRYPHGPGCGSRSIHREELDNGIEQLISKRMLDAKFFAEILETATARPAVSDPVRIAIEKAKANLAAGRKELLEMVRHHDITRKEFQEQIGLLETELRQNEALLPAAPPTIDAKKFLQTIANTFAIFTRLPFGKKREILTSAVKSIVCNAEARTLTSITICGGFLGRANGQLSLKRQLAIRPVPDLLIQFPEPFEIPDTYVDGRDRNGRHPNSIATRFRERIQ